MLTLRNGGCVEDYCLDSLFKTLPRAMEENEKKALSDQKTFGYAALKLVRFTSETVAVKRTKTPT